MITFEYPYLFLLIFIPFLVRYFLPPVKGLYGSALKVPFVTDFKNIAKINSKALGFAVSSSGLSKKWLTALLIWLLLVFAFMRPIKIGEPIRLEGKSRDVLMVTDISTSMLEDDFYFQGKRISRIGAVKAVVSDFVNRRTSDRLGLILFGTRAYLQAPLTFDRNSVQEILWSMEAGMAGNSTAIGDALGLALKSLQNSDESLNNKVIILLTDGENNDGSISLPEAIMMAKSEGVKVYTIGVGSSGFSSLANAFFGNMVSNLDETGLRALAEETKGHYFRADDLKSLLEVYQAIDVLEPVDTKQNYIYPRQELYYIPLLAAVLLASVLIFIFRRQ
ncbi:MAG: VWA domain-containing protein [Alphaproteobacteria bacterium]|nr:VWA domain-containing protein [Alphaproteobacteria bacterium]